MKDLVVSKRIDQWVLTSYFFVTLNFKPIEKIAKPLSFHILLFHSLLSPDCATGYQFSNCCDADLHTAERPRILLGIIFSRPSV